MVTQGADDIEAYADFIGEVSALEMAETRVARHVDRLDVDDWGFLSGYESYSFASTAQMSHGNVTQGQVNKVLTMNSLNPMHPQDLKEPLIQKVISAQKATGEGFSALPFYRSVRLPYKQPKQNLSCFHLASTISTERAR